MGSPDTAEEERRKPLGSPIVAAGAVGPEVVFVGDAHIHQPVVERILPALHGVARPQVGIIGLHIAGIAFEFAVARHNAQSRRRIEIVTPQQAPHRLHVAEEVAVEVALIVHPTGRRPNLHTILRVVLRPGRGGGQKCQQYREKHLAHGNGF